MLTHRANDFKYQKYVLLYHVLSDLFKILTIFLQINITTVFKDLFALKLRECKSKKQALPKDLTMQL